MAKPKEFNLLVVNSDGRRVVRLALPRWLFFAVTGLLLTVPLSVALIYGDYLQLRRERATLTQLSKRVAEQQTQIESSEAGIRHLRTEIDGWRDLHAKIWEPFGPEYGPAKKSTGIGGPTGPTRAGEIADRGAIGDELARLTGQVKAEGDSLRSLERFLGRATKVLAALPSRWPVRGPVNSGFGGRTSPWSAQSEFHSGLDIGAQIGTPVKSPAPGTVVFAGSHSEFGQTLIIDHGNDTKSLYGHLSKLQASVNQKVSRGDVIALTGNTGRSSGPHLHYEIQVGGQSVNPTGYLWE
jgi:murein DD-endopeptidase MepM/ murein hydrolase activator NlpD